MNKRIVLLLLICVAVIGWMAARSLLSPKPSPNPPETTPSTAQEEPITAQTLIGTAWQCRAYTFTFQQDGKVTINDNTRGTWSLKDNAITIHAQAQTKILMVNQNQMIMDGILCQRIH